MTKNPRFLTIPAREWKRTPVSFLFPHGNDKEPQVPYYSRTVTAKNPRFFIIPIQKQQKFHLVLYR